MNKVIRSLATVCLLLVMMVALSISASAEVYQTRPDSVITGNLGTFSLDATVYRDLVDSRYVYTYEYALTYDTYGAEEFLAEGFQIGNLSKAAIFDVSNTGDFTDFADGVYDPIVWLGNYIDEGQTVTFSFKSFNRPFENPISVNCNVLDGGTTAIGETIGMAAMIPEPSAFAAVGLGILGVLPMIKRRK